MLIVNLYLLHVIPFISLVFLTDQSNKCVYFVTILLFVSVGVTKQIVVFASVKNRNVIISKKKQEVKLKEPVRIRFKQFAIYWDYYTGDVIREENYVGGKRQYEFLKLYLIPEKTREDKAKNEVTLAIAKAIQSKRIIQLQNDVHGLQNTNKSKVNVIDYLMNMRNQFKERGSLNYEKTIDNAIRELKLFRGVIQLFVIQIRTF